MKNSALLDICKTLFSYLAYSSTLEMVATFSQEYLLTSNGLYGIVTQKIELFITTAVRASNPKIILSSNVSRRYQETVTLFFPENVCGFPQAQQATAEIGPSKNPQLLHVISLSTHHS
jgi:hypothetical protein